MYGKDSKYISKKKRKVLVSANGRLGYLDDEPFSTVDN